MRILFLSRRGKGLGIADRIGREGHDVMVYIQDEQALLSGDNYLHKVGSWRSVLSETSLVICDEPGFGARTDALRGNGRPVLGCDPLADVAEADPQKQLQLLEHCELDYPDVDFWFPDDRSALPEFRPSYVRTRDPWGGQTVGPITTEREWSWFLTCVRESATVMVQEIAPGIECNIVGLWNGRGFLSPSFVAFDYRHSHAGDQGAAVDCAGLILRPLEKGSKLVAETLAKLSPFLLKLAYRGMVTLRCVVNEAGLHVLGVRIGFSYDAFDALGTALYEDSLGDVLFDCAIGVNRDLKVSKDFIACVRLTVPPWPEVPSQAYRGLPVRGIDEKTLPWVNLCDVYKLSDGPAFAAGTGVVLKALAPGRNVAEATSRVYRTLGNVRILHGQYRTDIGHDAAARYDELRSQGWIS